MGGCRLGAFWGFGRWGFHVNFAAGTINEGIMIIEAEADLQGMKKVASVVGETLKRMREHAKVGMSTKELDDFGAEILQSYGAESAPIREYDFPGWTCISINDAAAHGVPSDKLILQEGDMVNILLSVVVISLMTCRTTYVYSSY